MRFCMVSTFYPPFSFGGDAISVQNLSRALAKRGHEVTVVHDVDAFAVLHHGPMPAIRDDEDDQGIRVVRLKSGWGGLSPLLTHQLGRPVAHSRRLRAMLSDDRFDVVHFHNPSLVGAPGLLTWPRSALRVYTAHEHWLVCPTHVLWRLQKEPCTSRTCLRCLASYRRPPQAWRYTGALARALNQLDLLLALTEYSRETHRALGVRKEMTVLPNFVPDRPDRASLDEGSPHPRPYVFFAGRLERIKGLDDVLPVLASIPDADLLIAGDGGHGARLRRLAGGCPNIRFLGRREPAEMPRFYRHAVAVLVPSVGHEILPLVVLEAMREGAPVVVRRVGGNQEIVEASGGGVTFATEEELRSTLCRLLEDREYRASLGAKAAEGVKAYWAEGVVVPSYLDLIRQARLKRGLGN